MKNKSILSAFLIAVFTFILISCENKSVTKIGEIHANDKISNQIAGFYKAIEAKDSQLVASMLADDFTAINTPLLDTPLKRGSYAEQVSVFSKSDKKQWLKMFSYSFIVSADSILFDSPKITTFYYSNGDTTINIKSTQSAIFKTSKRKVKAPYSAIIKWKNNRISEISLLSIHWYDFAMMDYYDGIKIPSGGSGGDYTSLSGGDYSPWGYSKDSTDGSSSPYGYELKQQIKDTSYSGGSKN